MEQYDIYLMVVCLFYDPDKNIKHAFFRVRETWSGEFTAPWWLFNMHENCKCSWSRHWDLGIFWICIIIRCFDWYNSTFSHSSYPHFFPEHLYTDVLHVPNSFLIIWLFVQSYTSKWQFRFWFWSGLFSIPNNFINRV